MASWHPTTLIVIFAKLHFIMQAFQFILNGDQMFFLPLFINLVDVFVRHQSFTRKSQVKISLTGWMEQFEHNFPPDHISRLIVFAIRHDEYVSVWPAPPFRLVKDVGLELWVVPVLWWLQGRVFLPV